MTRRTLLLADDSVTIQRVIELTFADEDVQVIAVGDGDQAIARIDASPPDIVLADVAMPGKTGYEVASYIKGSERLSHIPVLLLTGAFEPVDQRKAAEARCDGVLAKPFEPQFVIGRVKELLGMSRGGSAATAATIALPVVASPAPATIVLPVVASPAPAPTSSVTSGTGNGAGGAAASLDDYLDQLDAALGNLPAPGAAAASAVSPASTAPEPAPADRRKEEDYWNISLDPGPETSEAVAEVPQAPHAAPPSFAPSGYTAPPRHERPALPALAEAFAALLAAEQDTSAPAAALWQTPPTVSDEVVERVVERVLQRLSDQVVRETVTELVSTLAERLIRDEIERLKSSIT